MLTASTSEYMLQWYSKIYSSFSWFWFCSHTVNAYKACIRLSLKQRKPFIFTSSTWFQIWSGLLAASAADPKQIHGGCSAAQVVLRLPPWLLPIWTPDLSSGSAVGTLSIQLRVHSGRLGKEIRLCCHTWLMSLCSSTLSLISSPPSSSGSLSTVTHVFYKRAYGECFCLCDMQTRRLFCVCGRENEMKIRQRMEETEMNAQ